MNSSKKQILVIILVLVSLGLSLSFGIFIGRESVEPEKRIIGIGGKDIGKPEELDFSIFWDSWRHIEENFAFPENLDRQKMIYGAISGLLKSTGDPYSIFLDPEDTKKFQEDISGRFEGIGAELGIRKGVLTIIAPLKNTPAERAGLRAGDQIFEINGEMTTDLTLDEAVSKIRGPKGTEVSLTIFRKDWEKTQEIKIVRDVIEIPTLDWEVLEENIAYIRLYQFTEKTSLDFQNATLEILNSKADRIILDLRNNPGGVLDETVKLAGHFLNKDSLVAIEDFTDTKEDKEYRTKKTGELINFPLVVLINQGSASASEILAASLRHHRGVNPVRDYQNKEKRQGEQISNGVKLIGEKTFGKGSIQELLTLKDGSTIKLTVARWLAPDGVSISDKGLEPDIKVELTEEDFEAGRDPQLEKALGIIKHE